MRILVISLLLVLPFSGKGQSYNSSRIFAHNDYAREKPFHTAYGLGVGYIEADVFLQNGELMVAHYDHEITAGRTLRRLYLEPMAKMVQKNNGYAYAQKDKRLTIMIDLKTEGHATLETLVAQMKAYPSLIACPTLQFMISGNVPPPDTWGEYPEYIFFDGRPGVSYTEAQLKRVSMISTGFHQHIKWDGKKPLSGDDRKKMYDLIAVAHGHGKPFRFWATPDVPAAWQVLMEMKMDVIVTDDIEGLARFIRKGD